jgi:hypothetical protein
MMNFSMSGKRRMPVGFQNRMQVVKQLPRVPVVAHVIAPVVVPLIVDESNEIGENVNKSEENKIVYTIGEESHVEESVSVPVPEPVLEEPVIETLSNPAEEKHEEEKHAEEEHAEEEHEEEEEHAEEEHEEEEEHAEEEVKPVQDVKKNKKTSRK